MIMDPKDNQTPSEKTFSADYVSELRAENASWRTKLRDEQASNLTLQNQIDANTKVNTISTEFQKRGITANPKWVEQSKDQSVNDAVDLFLKNYPQFGQTDIPDGNKPSSETVHQAGPKKPEIPGVFKGQQKTNLPPGQPRDVMEVAKDPVARAKVRDRYRELLAHTNNTL